MATKVMASPMATSKGDQRLTFRPRLLAIGRFARAYATIATAPRTNGSRPSRLDIAPAWHTGAA
jgi:hypothetical protein